MVILTIKSNSLLITVWLNIMVILGYKTVDMNIDFSLLYSFKHVCISFPFPYSGMYTQMDSIFGWNTYD